MECLKLVSDLPQESESVALPRQLEEIEFALLAESGLRQKDQLVIYPIYGRKRILVLNRSRYLLTGQKAYECLVDSINIQLPSIVDLADNEQSCRYEIILCHFAGKERNDKSARYILRALGQRAFKLNGSLCFEAFLERGDVVTIDNNRLVFGAITEASGEEEFLVGNEKIVQSSINVLLEGETGTGKSRLAKLIHEQSGRSGRFVHINLSSFSEGLIESELFGHVKGAFTGAVGNKEGAFLEANRGTLFLDEIDSLPHSIQTKLLLFLDSKEIRPVGAASTTKVDVRLIFAAGKSLQHLVQKEKMRQDFYYRLSSGVVYKLPPLRERPGLIDSICQKLSVEDGIHIAPSLISFYKEVRWPGNVRQLIGHLNKKMVSAVGNKLVFDKEDELLLIENRMSQDTVKEEIISLEELKRKYAYKIYKYFDHDLRKSSQILGITQTTLRKLVAKKNDLGRNNIIEKDIFNKTLNS